MASAYIVVYLCVAILRLTYPFELEWLEGATLGHVRRVLTGARLYARPSLEFIPFSYPPLYYYLAALGVSSGIGGFVAMRVVSIAASVGSFLLIYVLVRPESGPRVAFVSAGLFAATYASSGAWLDLGRVDSLYLCLTLATVVGLARATSPRHFVAAGLLAALALLTKQTIVITLILVAPYLLVRNPRGFLYFIAALVAVGGGVELYLDKRSDGWFRYYVYELPRLRWAISSSAARLWTFAWNDLLRPLAPILAGALAALSMRRRHTTDAAALDRPVRIGLLTAGMILSSALARLEGGAWTNALLPAYAAAAVLFGLAAGRLPAGAVLTPIAAVLQFAVLVYNPRTLVPTSRDATAGHAIVARIRELPDGVLVLDHGYLAEIAGKRSFAHGWAMTDLLWADQGGAGRALETEVRGAIAARRFPALVLDPTPHWFAGDFAEHYRRADELPDPGAFLPVSGSRRRPEAIYLPR
jgi:4-amino-4-deoxy-L-arabinose transferase-like glycosyltransferase